MNSQYEQLLCHLWGDYVLQSGWMANNKTKRLSAAAIHAFVYTAMFAWIASPAASNVIFLTHLLIDRFDVARYVIYAKNLLLCPLSTDPEQKHETWQECSKTGFSPEVPEWMATWLKIIVDNTLHLTINYFAIKYL